MKLFLSAFTRWSVVPLIAVLFSFSVVAKEEHEHSHDTHSHDAPVSNESEKEHNDHESHDEPPSHAEHDTHEHSASEHQHDSHDDHDNHETHDSNPNQDAHGHGHGHDEHEEKNYVDISPAMAKEVGITTSVATGGTLSRQLQVYGRLVLPPQQIAKVQARFPGLVKAIHVTAGDHIQKGDLLAVIESNESLRSYEVRAPIAGIVQSRNSYLGEVTGSAPLFTLVNIEQLWAELRVFPGQRVGVKHDQPVTLTIENDKLAGVVEHLIPAFNGEPFVTVRVTVDNHDERYAPGDLVTGWITVASEHLPLVVDNKALQTVREQDAIFMANGNRYEVRALTLGRRDSHITEVLSGLQAGERYVTGNSYLLKADLEKAGAAHEH